MDLANEVMDFEIYKSEEISIYAVVRLHKTWQITKTNSTSSKCRKRGD